MNLKKHIRNIPDFPKKGILFYDITTLINNKKAFKTAIEQLAKALKGKKIDYILAAESRGFIFGGALAYKLGCGFVPVRKPGKLPSKTYRHTYSLEYGTDSLEIHRDAFAAGSRVLVLDDLLATGGTALAMIKLARKLKGKIAGVLFLIELIGLGGRKKLKGYSVYSLMELAA
ncbi:MAG: adenine phosphoribosyltransferase [Candidatus Omnitrophica bacterium]|nr:adenine phosphoribosyltransferase [Candidatus Omnitrophota bacterium]MDD5429086.1 adenine phosphoribosyltransferase [Candidatus Omnitrophota bacterium]